MSSLTDRRLRKHRERLSSPINWLIGLAGLALLASFLLPFAGQRQWLQSSELSLLQTVWLLRQSNEWLLFIAVFLFSIVLPIAKWLVLAYISWRPDNTGAVSLRLLRLVHRIGHWSMLDVLILVLVVFATDLGFLNQYRVMAGAYAFMLAVLLSAIACQCLWFRYYRLELQSLDPVKKTHRGDLLLGIASIVTYLLAINLPILEITRWWIWRQQLSTMQWLAELYLNDSSLLAFVLLVIFVVIPVLYFAMTSLVRISATRQRLLVQVIWCLQHWMLSGVYCLAMLVVCFKLDGMVKVMLAPAFWLLVLSALLMYWDRQRLQRLYHYTFRQTGVNSGLFESTQQ